MKNKRPVLEKKTVEKYYLDGEEITESEYKAIKRYVERFCNNCWEDKKRTEALLDWYSSPSCLGVSLD